ncbi:metallo-beta-lactamase superfamily protein [Colletotrichum phormii]|uniref:Metallo-beta-lactamase superfamily protein n=1 Tax=Colletotrichum phormii TaxID=359342 RepID=A0AAI9ZVN7_9PEZI|nr:metallo-beta-lactamase superfamily protein [Colletotrichum phormii]KAK1637833.1 metallo-beta-lactamase superfamily protein [Colletotrichum phormii]
MANAQALGIPPGKTSVKVSIIDTTFDADIPTGMFLGPAIKGFDRWHAVAYAFLITHVDTEGRERRVIFDLGSPTDLENDFPPPVVQSIKSLGSRMEAKHYVSEILENNGVPLESIEGMIWSHAHCDHVGRPSLFPKSTSLIVGPGVKSSFFLGFPAVQDSPVWAREFEGREVLELKFNDNLKIGGFDAIDYFGDGSFYLLLAPGHSVGHFNALARTSEDTYIYFAGDSFHHTALLRPHPGARLPSEINMPGGTCCSGAAFHPIHPVGRGADEDPNVTPFCTVPELPSGEPVMTLHLQDARDTIKAVQKFDADPNVFVIAAHDASLHDVLDFFPKDGSEWQAKGWKEKGRWQSLHDFAALVNAS